MATLEGIQKAGDVVIEKLLLISHDNVVFDLTEFFVEFNLYEDIFSNYLHGNMLLSDSRNLIENVPIIGEEYLIVKLTTPSFPKSIEKTFRVYKASDRVIVRDNNTQNFILHFASIEVFYDILLPLFVPFEGRIDNVVGEIFENYISANRDYQVNSNVDEIKELEYVTPLYVLNEVANSVKFVSPGWTPFKCINWLASKAIPKNETARNFLFFESNKSFYFTSMEYLFKDAVETNNYIGVYSTGVADVPDSNPIQRNFFLAKNVEMIESTDHVKNYTNGYLANRLITLDVFNKKYENVQYDYVNEYKKQFHTSGSGTTSKPIFTENSLRNHSTDISFYPVNPKLFTGFSDNVNENMKYVHGNRKSSLLDLRNVRMNITVPGRTDIEVGNMLYYYYPSLEGSDETDTFRSKQDLLYSGYYLISAIHHRVIVGGRHEMTMELVKDSLYISEQI